MLCILELAHLPIVDALLERQLVLEIATPRLGLIPLFAHFLDALGEVDKLRQEALCVECVLNAH